MKKVREGDALCEGLSAQADLEEDRRDGEKLREIKERL